MAFCAGLPQLEALYTPHAGDLFALCYLYAAPKGQTFSLLRECLEDLYTMEKRWQKAQSGEAGFLWSVHRTCCDFYAKDPKARKKAKPSGEGGSLALPFSLTDPLRAILRLPGRYKTPLYLCVCRGWTAAQAAQVTGSSPARVESLVVAALKKLDMPREKAAAVLATVQPGEAAPRAWERFAAAAEQPDFQKKQRSRRFWQGVDNAVPFLALGLIVLAAAAYLGVEQGWFTGRPYAPSAAVESQPASSAPREPADVSVYVPEEGGFVEYTVHNTPYDWEGLVRQMVYLGGAPEGSSYVSSHQEGDTLTVELAGASPVDGPLLQAMAATLQAFSGAEHLSLRCDGQELTADSQTAQDLLKASLPVTRTAEVDYRE